MQIAITRWGNSHGIRIPKHLLESVGMSESDKVEIVTENKNLVIKKISSIKHLTTKERLANFNGDYTFEEWDTGEPIGCEVINDEYV
ncbi:MAG: AbrB/MazE/SpoVT family DNA-binding domain-containing protein [Oscillospiraceae bacterium]|nr:AbrB/MazE/SpoVT family DNA-binding domain-containing protein [Oscillospiraceae bacterium]